MGVALLILWVLLGVVGYRMARERGRDPVMGAVLGFVLGLIGLIIIAALPKRTPDSLQNVWQPLAPGEAPLPAHLSPAPMVPQFPVAPAVATPPAPASVGYAVPQPPQ